MAAKGAAYSNNFVRNLNTSSKVYAVIGDPIAHSKSPLMHNAALQEMEVDGVYTAFHVKPEQLEHAVAGIRALGLGGVNVTIPHKEQVMAYLDEIDESARVIGAVNTIVHCEGKLYGYNTDGLGYVRSLQEEMQADIPSSRIVIIGAGGAARGIAYALLAEGCKELTIANRTVERAHALAEELSGFGKVRSVMLNDTPAIPPQDVDIVIQTTSVGMHPHIDEMPVAKEWIQSHMLVSDIIYNPLETALLQAAKAQGCRIHNGLGMFVHQGAIAFELWTGMKAPTELMRQKVLETLNCKQ
ncbi:shikimate dehydrogenase [Paenibacillus alvei]|uniref:Shikimate dehydrogenase (NADP(+)) n=1 Tax=Paenibacillus alvei TaxID=44250 RepID=A0AAP6ZT57_PAEAL|nr:shikimate dehydrogenase [Paenibacillus alvei]NOJ69795.1 shikimate dehydrogenase [Paenibacillus alvei]